MQHILALDIGNTETKGAIFAPGNHTALHYAGGTLGEVVLHLLSYTQYPRVIVSNVTHADPMAYLPADLPVHHFGSKTPIPFQNLYETPETLGLDRLANAAAAYFLYPRKNVLVVDFGTCIKYDFLDQQGRYLGGSISPGLQMRFKSLHAFTDRLPEVAFNLEAPTIGKNTTTALQSGVQEGIYHEVFGFIAQYEREYEKINVIFTGGDAIHFAPRFKNRIFAAPLLTLIGLAGIIAIND
jgi:type III pantothenate kinase